MADTAPILALDNVSKIFGRGDSAVYAARSVSFALHPGRTLALVGESGSGKTTAARLIMREYQPDAGQLLFRGQPIGSSAVSSLKAYRAAVQIDPNFFGAYSSIGGLHLDAGRYAEARTAFDKAVALNPDDVNSLYQRGTTLADLGEFDAARGDVARAIELKSDEAAYYDQLAAIDLAKGDAQAAVADVERGVAVSPDYWGGAAMLAYYLVGKFDRTIAMAEAGQKAEPDYPYFAIWKALAQKGSGDGAGSIATLDAGRAAMGSSDWPAALMEHLAGRISDSKLRAQAASNDPKTQAERLCEINFYAGELAYIAGDKAAARTALQAAVASRIYRYLEFVAAKARLAQLGG